MLGLADVQRGKINSPFSSPDLGLFFRSVRGLQMFPHVDDKSEAVVYMYHRYTFTEDDAI